MLYYLFIYEHIAATQKKKQNYYLNLAVAWSHNIFTFTIACEVNYRWFPIFDFDWQ